MAVYTEIIKLKTKSQKIYNITNKVEEIVRSSDIEDGLCLVFVPGSTGAILLNEDDPMLLEDLKDVLEHIASKETLWHHPENAHSHIRASLIGSEKLIPVHAKKLVLGQWQDIMFCEFDTRSRERQVIVSVIG